MPDIRALLDASMTAHNEAIRARREKRSDRPHIEEALRLRQEAHEADPDHADPAWQGEQSKTAPNQDTHAALMAFYAQRLAR